jgi:hypothetical protein
MDSVDILMSNIFYIFHIRKYCRNVGVIDVLIIHLTAFLLLNLWRVTSLSCGQPPNNHHSFLDSSQTEPFPVPSNSAFLCPMV